MDKNTRAKVIAILKEHERFDQDFTKRMPQKIRDASDEVQNKWLFSQAAVWPDLMRDKKLPDKVRKAYHRPYWHFIDEPLFLSKSAREAFGPVPVNLSKDWRQAGQPALVAHTRTRCSEIRGGFLARRTRS